MEAKVMKERKREKEKDVKVKINPKTVSLGVNLQRFQFLLDVKLEILFHNA